MPTRPPLHIPSGHQSEAARKHAYDVARGSQSRVYGRRWQKVRASHLARFPLCELCLPRLTPATVVDHRQPHHGDHVLMWLPGNLRSLCKPCHDAKTAREDGGFGNPVRHAIR